MLERYIRELGVFYIKDNHEDIADLEKLKSILEERFSADYLSIMLHSMLFFYIKKGTLKEFISENRHELLPDKLSGMVQDDHSVLSYLERYTKKTNKPLTPVTVLLIDMLKSIKKNLRIDKNEYKDDGTINMQKGDIVPISIDALSTETERKYKAVSEVVTSNKFLVSYYAHYMGINTIKAYKEAASLRNNKKLMNTVGFLVDNSTKIMAGNKNNKPIIRPLYSLIAQLSGNKSILKDFDSKPFSKEQSDIGITLAVCINNGFD